MNPYSGEIEYFSRPGAVPRGWLVLTDEEAREFATLTNDERLKRYIERHGDDKCGACGCFIRSHHLNRFKECAATELARIDTARHEESMKQFLEAIPVREPLSAASLRERMRQHQDALIAGK